MAINLTEYILTGKVSPKPRPKRRRKAPATLLVRRWGQDTVRSQYYICVVHDLTDQTLYFCGGLGKTEQLVDRLTVKRKRPHELQVFTDLKTEEKAPYKIVSKNGRSNGGAGFPTESSQWKKVVVLPNNADFHFMLVNHTGRR